MKKDTIWKHIHSERALMADTLADLPAEAWATPSLCAGWSVQEMTGHIPPTGSTPCRRHDRASDSPDLICLVSETRKRVCG